MSAVFGDGTANAAAALKKFGEAWWELALGDYTNARRVGSPSYEGFVAWYRKVYEVTPEPPAFVAQALSPEGLKARATLAQWREEWKRGEL